MNRTIGYDEKAQVALSCIEFPQARTFLENMLSEMNDSDEEGWRRALEFAGNQLNDMAVEPWNDDDAECCIENITFLLYDCKMPPSAIQHLVRGGV